MYLRINNAKSVLFEEDESDSVLFFIATSIHVVAISILFHSCHESLNSSALIFESFNYSFIDFWKNLLPVYGKIILTIAIVLFIFGILIFST